MSTLVLGIGNLVRGDDGLGSHAVQKLRHHPGLPDFVNVVDGGTLGLSLLSLLAGVDRLLVIDAIDVGEKPGTVVRLDGDAAIRLPGNRSVHEVGFADLIGALRLLDQCPKEIVVLGVQPETIEWSADLSPCVSASLERLISVALDQLTSWSPGARAA